MAATPVVLEVGCEDSAVQFRVLDEGPGLSEAECAIAPRRFWRASQGAEGSGLGLSITASIAAHYGGQLALSPRQPRGLCARLSVPTLAPAQASGGAARVRSNP